MSTLLDVLRIGPHSDRASIEAALTTLRAKLASTDDAEVAAEVRVAIDDALGLWARG